MSLDGLVERKAVVHDRLHLAGSDELEQVAPPLGDGVLLVVEHRVEAEARNVLHSGQGEGGQIRDVAGGRTVEDEGAELGGDAQGFQQDVAADGLEDDVGAAAVGGGEDLVGPVLVAVVDGDVGAEFAREVELGLGTGGGDDLAGAESLGDLDGQVADAAGGRVDQDGLAGLEAAGFPDRVVRGLGRAGQEDAAAASRSCGILMSQSVPATT